ncbi:MAG: hybrid sensor histidine kinase/response regulator [Candidatus Eisenbacteria bacterium]
MSIKPLILGVDDNPRNLAILRKILGQDYDFVPVASGEEAIEATYRLRPDLVLLDIMMPGIDGYETCRRLRANPRLSWTKIIMVSAKAMTSERLEGYAAGADDYMVKPFDPEEMLAKVRVYLRLKSVEEVDRLKTDVLNLLSHETRTPLTVILSPIALLLESPGVTDQQRRILTMVESGARRLLALFERVSFLSQLKAGSVPFVPERQELRSIAQAAIESARETAESAGIRVALEIEHPAPVNGDPKHLQRAVGALLDNAIRVSPKGETVVVRTWTSDSRSILSVSDRGPGIAPELLPHLFEEFAVADVAHHSHGHGLSLAIARSIVGQHGGSIAVEGGDGGGATFRLDLPATAAGAAAG